MSPPDEPALRRLAVVAAGALLFALALSRAYVNGDALLYIATGRFVLDHGALPEVDPFSFVSTKAPLLLHMLLPMVGFAAVDAALGLPALSLLVALFVAGTFALALALAARSPAALWVMGLALALAVAVDRELFEVRGQAIAYLPLVLVVLGVWRLLHGGRRAALAGLPLGFLWALTHPSFPFGALLPLLVALSILFVEPRVRDRVRNADSAAAPLAAFAGLFVVGACATPYGPPLVVDVLSLVGDPTTSRIDHMRSPPLTLPWLAFIAHAALGLVAHVLWGARRNRRALALVGCALLAMTLVSRRYAIYLVVTEALWLVPLAGALGRRVPERVASALNGALVFACAAFALVRAGAPLPAVDEDLPVDAVLALEAAGCADPVLTEFAWGGYWMYRMGEARPGFIDGRNNLYGNGVFDDYLVLVHAPERADAILDLYGIQTVLWMRDWKLTAHLRAQPERWRVRYEDAHAIVFERAPPAANVSDEAAPRDPSRTPGSSPTP